MIPGIGSWLTKRSILSPKKEAVVYGETRLTFYELNKRVNQLSNALIELGYKKGDRISILSFNCIEYIEVIMAAAKIGLILVPLNWRLTSSELVFNITDSGAKTLFYHPELAALAEDTLKKIKNMDKICLGDDVNSYENLLHNSSEDEPIINNAPNLNSPHIIMYTSGTTGKPKGAVLTQGASFWNAVNLILACDFTSKDRNLAILPMFHIGGIGLFTLPMLYIGGTVIIQKTFEPYQTLKLLKEEKISLFFGVPAIFAQLINHPQFNKDCFSSVRILMSGGAPLPLSLINQYYKAGLILQQGFGMSEAAPSIATLSKELAIKKAGSVGQPVFHLNVRIVDNNMEDVPINEVGEMVIKGPNVMIEYWNRPKATEEAFRKGWFHTGDLARMDEDGALYIVDRKKDMFISGGENVYPAEIENILYEIPQIAETAVVGIKDEKWGEVGLAVIVLKQGKKLSSENIKEYLKHKLARFKIPKQIIFIDKLPRNAAGKVLKNVIKEKYTEEKCK